MTTNTTIDQTESILRRIVEELVVHRDMVDIAIPRPLSQLRPRYMFWLHCDPAEIRKVIGGGGAVIKSIQALVRLIGQANRFDMDVKVNDPEFKVAPMPDQKFKGNDPWNSSNVVGIASDIASLIFQHPVEVGMCDGDNFESVLEVAVSPQENRQLVEMVNGPMNTLFNAIGKANGRHLTVVVAAPEAEPSPKRW